jgi:hypothetical protein
MTLGMQCRYFYLFSILLAMLLDGSRFADYAMVDFVKNLIGNREEAIFCKFALSRFTIKKLERHLLQHAMLYVNRSPQTLMNE